MYCNQCGKKADKKDKFCHNCGSAISESKQKNATLTIKSTFHTKSLKHVIREKSVRRAIALSLTVSGLFLLLLSDTNSWWLWGTGTLIAGYYTYKRLIDLDDSDHYCYKLVDFFSDLSSINELSNTVNKIKKEGESDQFGSYKVFNNKLLEKDSFFDYEVYPLAMCTWVYKKVLSHKLYGIVTTSKDYSVVMHFPYNRQIEITSTDKQSNENLLKLVYLCPNAKVGYTN